MFNGSFLLDYSLLHCENTAVSHVLQSLRKLPVRAFYTSKWTVRGGAGLCASVCLSVHWDKQLLFHCIVSGIN